MMTNGPEATIGRIVEVDLPRPRTRKALVEHPDYYRYRAAVLEFLEEYEHGAHAEEGSRLMARRPRDAATRPAFILATEVWVPDPAGDVLIRADGLYGPLEGLRQRPAPTTASPAARASPAAPGRKAARSC